MPSSNKHKILLVVTQAEWGGAQKYVFDLAVNLSADDYQVQVAVGEPQGKQQLAEKLKMSKITVFPLKHLIRKLSLIQDILAVKELTNLIKQEQPSILHLNSSKAGFLGAIAGRLAGKNRPQVVFTAHGWAFMEPLPFYKFWLFMIMEKMASCWRQATIVLSEKEKQVALKYRLVR
ncbi:MAG: glycosyltransferase, partial [Candidatus Magasanikbacteria bacterium]|nr:glycosyltransferase [Candidatus Magasanikbacteria bacterium]